MGEDPLAIHIPVLLKASLEYLAPKDNGYYLDGTLGLGGHAEKLLELAPGSHLCALDRDEEALRLAKERLAPFGDRVKYFHLPYADFERALNELDWPGLDGAFLDLGLSSLQLDNGERGFSFNHDGPLDMRMDQGNHGKSAKELVNRCHFDELREIIATLGEEPQAGRIARVIVNARQKRPIESTLELADLIWSAYPPAWRKKSRRHPATRTFQALRMAVNGELEQLKVFLNLIWPHIRPGGRLVIISFHSLEDRLVKQAMRRWADGRQTGPEASSCEDAHEPEARILLKKPLTPDEAEMALNPRSSSAKLRAVEKL